MIVRKAFDQGVVEVEQEWLDRAKELLKQHGIVNTEPYKVLEREMNVPPYSEITSVLLVIAGKELYEEGHSKVE